MFNGDSRRLLDIYVSLNERIRAEYGKGSIETAERLLELVGLDDNELSEYWQMFETLMKDNEKCGAARGEQGSSSARLQLRSSIVMSCFDSKTRGEDPVTPVLSIEGRI